MPAQRMRQLELRMAKMEGHVAQAQAGALIALDAVSRIGTGLDVDMPAVFMEARERLHWKQGGLQLKPSKTPGANVSLPTLAHQELAAGPPVEVHAPGTPAKPRKLKIGGTPKDKSGLFQVAISEDGGKEWVNLTDPKAWPEVEALAARIAAKGPHVKVKVLRVKVPRVCVVTGAHQVCKDTAGKKIRKMVRRGTHAAKPSGE